MTPDPASPDRAAAADEPEVWTDVAWQRLATRGLDPAFGSLQGVAAVGGGLIAWGQGSSPRANPDGLTDTLTVWLSADGTTWRSTPILDGVDPLSVSSGTDLAVGPHGLLLIGGTCCEREEPAAWLSRDGLAWHRVPIPAARDSYARAVAAGSDGFVIAANGPGGMSLWTSPDGRSWDVVDPVEADLGRGDLGDVVAWGEGFVAVGMDDRNGRDSQAAVWVSSGLGDWRRVAAADPALAGPDEASMSVAVPFARGLFVTGGSGTQAERRACERLLEGGVLTAGPATALSCGWLREMNWRSADGSTWERVDPWAPDGEYPPTPIPPTGRAPIAWRPLVSGGPGLVGVVPELMPNGQPGPNGDELGVWASADGATWARIADAPDEMGTVAAIARVGRRLWAVTHDGAVWLGTAQR